jgi:spermidine/putrescine-binding protein
MRIQLISQNTDKMAMLAAAILGAVAGGTLAAAAAPSVAGFVVGLWRDYVSEGFLQTLGTFFFC